MDEGIAGEHAGEKAANEVGFGTRRSLFARVHVEDGAHANFVRVRAACAASVACASSGSDFLGPPTELGFESVERLSAGSFAVYRVRIGLRQLNVREPQVLSHPHGRGRNFFAGVEQAIRVEDLLEFTEDVGKRAELASQERRAAETVTMLAADGAVERPDFVVKLGGKRFHGANVVNIGQVDERADVKLALRGMAKNRGRELQTLERVLHVPQEDGQSFHGDRDILDEWRWPAGALHLVQRGNKALGESPVELKVSLVFGNVRGGGKASSVNGRLHHFIDTCVEFVLRVGLVFDQEYGLGFAWDQQFVTHIGFAREIQVPAVHQVARRGIERRNLQRGVSGFLEAIEQEKRTATVLWQRIDGEGGFGDKGERALASGEQASQVETAVGDDVINLVSATIDKGFRAVLLDRACMTSQQARRGSDERLQAIGIGINRSLGERWID